MCDLTWPQHISWFLPCFPEVGPVETTPSPGCVVGSIPSLAFLQAREPRALCRGSAQRGHWVSPPEDPADSRDTCAQACGLLVVCVQFHSLLQPPLLTAVSFGLLTMPVLGPEMSRWHLWEKSGLSPRLLAMSSGRPITAAHSPCCKWAVMLTV